MQILENDGLRANVKKLALSKLTGADAHLKWYLERPDGSFDASNGRVYTAEQMEAKTTAKILIEEIKGDPLTD